MYRYVHMYFSMQHLNNTYTSVYIFVYTHRGRGCQKPNEVQPLYYVNVLSGFMGCREMGRLGMAACIGDCV